MKIKGRVKKAYVKGYRRVVGKPKEMMITTGKGGLTKSEIKEVLNTIGQARKQGLIPPMTYNYRPPTFIDRREPIFLKPKSGTLASATGKVRRVLRARFGAGIMVKL